MKVIRLVLLVLIILGVGLLVTRAHWVPSLVNTIMSHEPAPVVVPVSTTATSTKPVPVSHPPKPVPTPVPQPVTGGVDIYATIGPTCPVMQNPPDPQCADKPYETTLVLASTITGRNGGVLIKTNAQGRFSEALGPGTYTVRAQSDAMLPRLSPVTFTVEANKRTQLHLQFDSGIR